MKNIKNLIFVIAIFLTIGVSAQQTPQTSFFTQSRAFWNPAYTGFGDKLAFNAFVRQQWLGFGGQAPRTILMDFQYPFVNYNMAASGALQYDQTGPVSKKGINFNYAYHIKDLGQNNGQLSLGVTAGAQQYVFDPSDEVVNNEGDPLLSGGSQTSFFPNVGGGLFYISSMDQYKNNTNFFFGASFVQGYQTNVLLDQLNQKRVSQIVFDLGSKIYGYDYSIEPIVSVNFSKPEIIDVLAGLTFEMKDKFWAGIGYSSVQEFTIQGGYIFEEIAGRDTRLKVGMLANIGLGDKLSTFGPGAELFFRYELDMD